MTFVNAVGGRALTRKEKKEARMHDPGFQQMTAKTGYRGAASLSSLRKHEVIYVVHGMKKVKERENTDEENKNNK